MRIRFRRHPTTCMLVCIFDISLKTAFLLTFYFYTHLLVLDEGCCRSVLDLIKRILYEDIYRDHGSKPYSLLDALIEVSRDFFPFDRY